MNAKYKKEVIITKNKIMCMEQLKHTKLVKENANLSHVQIICVQGEFLIRWWTLP